LVLRIRLSRVGKKKQPAYRLVVADQRAPREGAFLKIIGHYDPLTNPATLVVKEEEAVYWLQKGAQPSETVAKLLSRLGVMEKAGKPPVKYEGKQVEPAAKKKAAAAEPAAAAAAEPAATAETEAEEPAAKAEVAPADEAPAEEVVSAPEETPAPEPEPEESGEAEEEATEEKATE
jgi:small subunit ribosomal protein S16